LSGTENLKDYACAELHALMEEDAKIGARRRLVCGRPGREWGRQTKKDDEFRPVIRLSHLQGIRSPVRDRPFQRQLWPTV